MCYRKKTFGEKVIRFNKRLHFDSPFPQGIEVMNPFKTSECAIQASRLFYEKFYNDENKRGIILGINPGRFGAGITGVPFTDPKRLREFCGIFLPECGTAHEPSSEFIYNVAEAMGGVEKFYARWYINSICPLGFVRENEHGRMVNFNYYDTPALLEAALPFILKTLPEQISFGIYTHVCVCLGTGKNYAHLCKINEKGHFFERVVAVEHPRYIMQYKTRSRKAYIDKYVATLNEIFPE